MGFIIVNNIIQKVNYEEKHPILNKIIKYYQRTSLIYVSIEIILCLICLLILVFFSFICVCAGIKYN